MPCNESLSMSFFIFPLYFNCLKTCLLCPAFPKLLKSNLSKTTEATTKRIGDTNWCKCGLCQPMESKAESLCCLDTNEVPNDYFDGYH